MRKNKFLSFALSAVMGMQSLFTPFMTSHASSVDNTNSMPTEAEVQQEIDDLRDGGMDPTVNPVETKYAAKANKKDSNVKASMSSTATKVKGYDRLKAGSVPMKVTFPAVAGADWGKLKTGYTLNDAGSVVTEINFNGAVKFENAHFRDGDTFKLKNIPTQKEKNPSSFEYSFHMIPQEDEELWANVRDATTGETESRHIGTYHVTEDSYVITLDGPDSVSDLRTLDLVFAYKGKINITFMGEKRDIGTPNNFVDTIGAFIYEPEGRLATDVDYEAKDEDRGDFSWHIQLHNTRYDFPSGSSISNFTNQAIWNTTKREMVQMMVRYTCGANKGRVSFYIKPPKMIGHYKSKTDDPLIGKDKTSPFSPENMDMYVSTAVNLGNQTLAGTYQDYYPIDIRDPRFRWDADMSDLYSNDPTSGKPYVIEEIEKDNLYKVTIDPNYLYDTYNLNPAEDLAVLDVYFTIYPEAGEQVKLQEEIENDISGMSPSDVEDYVKKYSFGYKKVDEYDNANWGDSGSFTGREYDGFRYWAPIKFTEASAGGKGDIESEGVVTPGDPSIKVEKSADFNDSDKPVTKAGDIIHYTVKITNNGDVDLFNVDLFDHLVINDDRDSVVFKRSDGREITLPTTDLKVGDYITATYEYEVTDEDMNHEYIDNKVYTKGKDDKGTEVEDDDDWKINVIPPAPKVDNPSIKVEKSADYNTTDKLITEAGQVIHYTVKITNNGDVDLHDVDLKDHLVINDDRDDVVFKREDGRDITLDKTDLKIGETITAEYEYTVTDADIEKGHIDNGVFTKGFDPDDNPVEDKDDWKIDVKDEPTPPIETPGDPHISVVKEADTKVVDHVGQEIKYTVKITNDGGVDLHDVDLKDHLVINSNRDDVVFKREDGRDITLDKTDLKIGETITAEYTYVVTDEDFKNEHLDNAVFTKGFDPDDNPVEDNDDWQIDVVRPGKPHISVTKEADTKVVDHVGQEVKYTVKITNDGKVDLHDVDLYDHLVINNNRDDVVFKREDGKEITLDKTDLAINETITAEYTYVVTDEDFKNEHLDNAVFTKGLDPDDNPVEDDDKWEIDVVRPQGPHISLTKEADTTKVDHVGQEINYTVKITNDGKVDLHDVNLKDHLVINDNRDEVVFRREDGREVDLEKTDLKVGETIIAKYIYVVTESDIEHKHIDNTAYVKGLDPDDNPVEDSDKWEIDVEKPGKPHISLTKEADTKVVDHVGQEINYTIKITNDGDVDLHDLNLKDHLVINDNRDEVVFKREDGRDIELSKTDLAVGETITAIYKYIVSEDNIEHKYIDNTAYVKGFDPDDNPVEDKDKWEIDVVKPGKPHISLTKTGDKTEVSKVGEVINYTVEITNDGDLDIKDLNLKDKLEAVNAKDVKINKDGARVIDLEKTELKVGETMTVKYSYKVTEEDLKSKYLKNLAFVVGKATNGEELTAEDDFIVKVKPVEITETGVNNTITAVGGLPIVGAIVLASISYGVYRKTKKD